MSATKIALENCIERLVVDQGHEPTSELYFALWDMVMSGEIAPVDIDGLKWTRGNRIFASTDLELLS